MNTQKDAPISLKCQVCGREWVEHFSLPMLVPVFLKRFKTLRCPKCGAGNIALQAGA